MKILAFTDTHGSMEDLINIVTKSRKVDLVVCAGDISWFGENLKEIFEKLSKIKVMVLVTHGNHETVSDLKKVCKNYDNIEFLHKNYYRFDKYLFFFYGGGGFSHTDKTFEKAAKDFKKNVKLGDKVIIVTHAPPFNTKLDIVNGEHVGNESITKYIKKVKPNLVISGHIHECEKNKQKMGKGLLVNPGPDGLVLRV